MCKDSNTNNYNDRASYNYTDYNIKNIKENSTNNYTENVLSFDYCDDGDDRFKCVIQMAWINAYYRLHVIQQNAKIHFMTLEIDSAHV